MIMMAFVGYFFAKEKLIPTKFYSGTECVPKTNDWCECVIARISGAFCGAGWIRHGDAA